MELVWGCQNDGIDIPQQCGIFWCPVGLLLQKRGLRREEAAEVLEKAIETSKRAPFEDHVLWGTGWLHPNMESHMPDDGVLVDYIRRIAPTKEAQ